jgi:membrane protease YdiL (CAAX protease family)
MFGIFHLHVSLAFAATTFGVSLVFGLLYARRRSLAGPTAAHFLLGLASVAFGLN